MIRIRRFRTIVQWPESVFAATAGYGLRGTAGRPEGRSAVKEPKRPDAPFPAARPTSHMS